MQNCSPEEIAAIFQQQHQKAPELALSTAGERLAKILPMVDYIREHKEAIYEAMHEDLRRGPTDTMAEMLMVKVEADFARKNLKKWMKPNKVKNSLMQADLMI